MSPCRQAAVLLLVALCAAQLPFTARAQEESESTPAQTPSPLAREPQTPEQYFDAVLLVSRLGQPDLARRYLEDLLALEPDDATLLELRRKHGTATFLQLVRMPELEPAAQELLNRVTAAATRQMQDPDYIRGLITSLSGRPGERDRAVDALRHLGADAAPPLIAQLASGDPAVDRPVIAFALARIGEPVVPPLLGALRAPNDSLRAEVIRILSYVGSRSTVLPHLWYPAYGDDVREGVRIAARESIARIFYGDEGKAAAIPSVGIADTLRTAALKTLREEMPFEPGEDGRVGFWEWDASQGTVVERRVAPELWRLLTAGQLAREALALAPDNLDAQAAFLAVALAQEVYHSETPSSMRTEPGTAYDRALAAGPSVNERVLELALSEQNMPAALAAAQVLFSVGDSSLLAPRGDERPPLVRALDAPDPRVQFAATATIVRLEPTSPFRGSSRVVQVLARALKGESRPHAVIVDPNDERATLLASWVGQLGLDTTIASTGQEGFDAAVRQPAALVILHLNTVRPELSQMVTSLRADSRTASVPIAVYGPRDMGDRIGLLLEQHPPAIYLDEASSGENLAVKLRPFVQAHEPLSGAERQQHASAAAYWLSRIATGRTAELFDLRPAEDALASAVDDPELAEDVLTALAAIPTPTAQERLMDAVTAPAFEVPIRSAAATHLARHIQRFGPLLTTEAQQAIRDAWRNDPNPEVRAAISAVIGSLKPSPETVSKLLEGPPPSPVTAP